MKTALSIAVVLYLFVSCTKYSLSDYVKNPGIDLRFCNIKTWTDIHGDEQRVNIFTYDDNENPISVTSNQQGTGSGHHFFTYDEDQRLIKYEFEFVHTKEYHYSSASRKALGAKVTDALGREFSETYTYDDKGRIIKSVKSLVSTPYEEDDIPDETREYIYQNDDLSSILLNGEQISQDVVYTNKASVYMTNKVWMFVNQNYSRHSTESVDSSNRLGLPLTFNPSKYSFPFLDIEGTGSTVTYFCR